MLSPAITRPSSFFLTRRGSMYFAKKGPVCIPLPLSICQVIFIEQHWCLGSQSLWLTDEKLSLFVHIRRMLDAVRRPWIVYSFNTGAIRGWRIHASCIGAKTWTSLGGEGVAARGVLSDSKTLRGISLPRIIHLWSFRSGRRQSSRSMCFLVRFGDNA